MYTIKNNLVNELIIKNSKFIALIYKINNLNEINYYLKEAKNNYKDATHYCYAYILDNIKKNSDDGEPSRTAGSPIQEVLEKNNLTNVLAIVVRYFGGIKLGSGGLIRAYSKSISSILNKKDFIKLEIGKNITTTFTYEKVSYIDHLLKDEMIINKKFTELITYNFNTTNNEIINILKNDDSIKTIINKEVLIEKK